MSKAKHLLIGETAQEYFGYVASLLELVDFTVLEQIVDQLRGVRETGASVYIMGNGGSASTASHFANDLGKAAKRGGQDPFKVFSLVDNVAWLSALANDEGYENVFAGQLENHLRPGDVVIVISASGNSTNLVRAVELAKARGVTSIGLLGFAGGVLLDMVDVPLHLPSEIGRYGPVEDVHLVLQHLITECLAGS